MAQRVLVPIDGSSRAEEVIPYAESLLDPEGEIVLLRVVPEPEPVVALLSETELASQSEVRDWWLERARKDGELARQHITIDAGRVRDEIAAGDPAEQIVRQAREQGADLIAMTTHGRGAVGQLLFGSVANRVSHVSPVPLLVVRPTASGVHPTPSLRRIVVPFDGSELAAEAFPLAAGLSQQLNLPVHLVQAVYAPAAPIPEVVLANISAAADADAAQQLEQAAAKVRDLGVTAAATWEVLQGSPFSAISAATRPGDIVVVTSHGRTGVRRWMLGSVAEKLVQQATVPVVLVPTQARKTLTATGESVT